MQARYVVTGMTCEHCVAHVTEEVSGLDGVEQVELGLDGRMTLTSSAPIEFSMIEAAVAEAGDYTVAPEDL